MRTLTLQWKNTFGRGTIPVEGKTKQSVLKEAEKTLLAQPVDRLSGMHITIGYKETRTIVVYKGWSIETDENGVGEANHFESRKACIAAFMKMCEEKGEHWD